MEVFSDAGIIKGLLWAIVVMGGAVISLGVYIWTERVKMYEREREDQKAVTNSINKSIKYLSDAVKEHSFRLDNLENKK